VQAEEEKPAHVKVPALLGLPLEVAGELLEARGLRLVVQHKSEHDEVPENAVIAQDPLPDSSLPPSAAVNVTLSTGKPKTAAVPDLAGKSLDAAKAELEAAGFTLGELSGPESGERVVASSSPTAGSPVPTGSAVALTLEAVGVEVPTLVGLPWAKAKKLIEERGLALGKVRERFDEDREGYVVLQQSPSAGTRVPAGSKLDIVRNEGD
jgi:serine/threonine-protein kinase